MKPKSISLSTAASKIDGVPSSPLAKKSSPKKGTAKRTTAERWKIIKESVQSGRYSRPRQFMDDLQHTHATINRRHKTLKRDGTFQIQNIKLQFLNDLAGKVGKNWDFTKSIPAEEQQKLSADRGGSKEASRENSSNECTEIAYRQALECILFPLLDHHDILTTRSERAQESSGSSSKETALQIQQQPISTTVFKELSKLVESHLKQEYSRAAKKSGAKLDRIYLEALAHFQQEVLIVRNHRLKSGKLRLSAEDLTGIMRANIEHAIERLPEDQSERRREETHLINSKLSRFADLLRRADDNVCTAEMLQSQQRQQKSESGSELRRSNSVPQLLGGMIGDFVEAVTNTAASVLLPINDRQRRVRCSTSPEQKSISLHSSKVDLRGSEDEDADETAGDLSEESLQLCEWLKSAFGRSRADHQKEIARIQYNSDLPRDIQKYFKGISVDLQKLKTEREVNSESQFAEINPPAFYYQQQLETQALISLINRIQTLYLPNQSPAATQLNENSRYVVTIRVVEAKGLALKRARTHNDAFVIVEHGKKQRYETEVCNVQHISLTNNSTARGESKKPIKISVWDSSVNDQLERPSIFSGKFWRDETDDFLGKISFSVKYLVSELQKCENQQLDRWFTLQKRSKRSNISGEIRLCISICPYDPDSSGGLEFIGSQDALGQSMPELGSQSTLNRTRQTSMDVYKGLLGKLLSYDTLQNAGCAGLGSLGRSSRAILAEFGERWRLNPVWREIVFIQELISRYQSYNQDNPKLATSIFALDAATFKLQAMINEAETNTMGVIEEEPSKTEIALDGRLVSYPPKVSGLGNLLITDQDRKLYRLLMKNLVEYQKQQISRYKECFPLDTPNGALMTTLNMINRYYSSQYEVNSNGGAVIVKDLLKSLVLTGSYDRYFRLNEMATPMKASFAKRLLNLTQLVREESETDLKYFRKPFAADLDLPSLTTGVYLKNLMLELGQLSQNLTQTLSSANNAKRPREAIDFSDLFDLYFCVRDLQRTLYSSVKFEEGDDETLKSEFQIHNWIAPCIQRWIEFSEDRLLEWVRSAVEIDKFEPLNQEHVHSTSIVDLFSCLNQIEECLGKLEWLEPIEGSQISAKLLNQRKNQWLAIVTQYSRAASRALAKYCLIISEKVTALHLKNATAKTKSGLLKKSGNTPITGACMEFPFQKACVMVNNFEKAREYLNTIYDELQVDKWVEFGESRRIVKNNILPADDGKANNQGTLMTGYLTIKVILAENLRACDISGSSDPYCLLSLIHQNMPVGKTNKNEPQIIGKTRTIPTNLNPKWNETFSWFVKQGQFLDILVNDWDLLKDELCAETRIDLCQIASKISDSQMHDVWLDLKPQGKILLRLQLEPCQLISSNSGLVDLADIDYYFRKSFRTLKNCTGDILAVLGNLIGEKLQDDLVRIAMDSEKHGEQGRGGSESIGRKLFHLGGKSKRNYDEDSADVKPSASNEQRFTLPKEIDNFVEPITEFLNMRLAEISQLLYPKLCREFLRCCWKEILSVVESLLIPQLYGDGYLLTLISRSKPLTERQVETLWNCVELLKYFFHAEGSEIGLPIKSLETTRYNNIKMLSEIYWSDLEIISEKFTEISMAETENRSQVHSDCLLRLGRIRAERCKHFKEWFSAELAKRSELRKLNVFTCENNIQVDKSAAI